jgi:hypothetical protein
MEDGLLFRMIRAFWDVASCSLVGVDRCFKRRSTQATLHGAAFQKSLNFIFAALRTWSLTCYLEFLLLLFFPPEYTSAYFRTLIRKYQGIVCTKEF